MNSSNSTDFGFSLDLLETIWDGLSREIGGFFPIVVIDIVTILTIFVSSILLIFPLYVYVYHKNKQREELTSSVFPITNHFYYIVMFMTWFYFVTIPTSIIISIYYSGKERVEEWEIDFRLLVALFIFLWYIIFSIISIVQNCLLFLLAVQRFFIYFFPPIVPYITPKGSSFRRWIIYVYLIVILSSIMLRVAKLSCMLESNHNTSNYYTCADQFDVIYMEFYFFSDGLVYFGAFLYFCIFVSVRKFTKLTKQIRSKPEKYIFIQTGLIIFVKMLFLPTIPLLMSEINMDTVFYLILFIDILTIPFVIQVSYLYCNRANHQTLLTLTGLRIFRSGVNAVNHNYTTDGSWKT